MPENTQDNPYTVRIIDIEAEGLNSLVYQIKHAYRYVNITWENDFIWTETSALNLFSNCSYLISIDTFIFTNVTNAHNMFINCNNLRFVNTSGLINVTNAAGMFYGCSSLINIDTAVFKNVESAGTMFYKCSSLVEIDTKAFTNVTYSSSMFDSCSSLIEVDLTPFVNLNNAYYMFNNCTRLEEVDLSSCLSVEMSFKMFNECPNLTLIKYSRFTSLNLKNYIMTLSADKEFVDFILNLPIDFYKDIVSKLDENTMDDPYKIRITDATGKSKEYWYECLNGVNRYVSLFFEEDIDLIDVHSCNVVKIDLNGLSELEYLNVSETDIESLNLLECVSLPYCKFEYVDEVKVLVKGWLAQNCKMLTTIKAMQEQVQDENLNLDNDTNACWGCDNLQEVEVSCKSVPSYAGNEVHYGKVDFKNDVTYKGVPLDEIGASTEKILNVLANTLFDVGSFIASKNPNFDPNRIFVGTTWKLLPAGKLLEQSDSNDNLGQEVDPALPNIKGDVYFNNGSNSVIGTGAMKKSTLRTIITGWIGAVTGNQLTVPNPKIDASDSSSIYKDDCNTVQPSTIKTNIWERIA